MDPQLRVQPDPLPLLLRSALPAAAALALLPLAGPALAPVAGARAQEPAAPAAEHDSAPPRPAAPPRPTGAAGRAELARRLDGLLDDPALDRAHVGLKVVVAETGEVLYERAARKRFTPASTMKLVTAAAALERLGAGYRWHTRLVAGGPVEDGVLRGDLWVVGGGDPGLERSDLRRWASALKEAGVRRIAGDVIGDGRSLGSPPWGRGWMWDELHLGWAAGVTGLQLDDSAIRVWVKPGASVGDSARLRVDPPGAEVPLALAVRTGPAGSRSRFRYRPGHRVPGTGRIEGWVPADADSVPLSLAPPSPTDRLLDALGSVLRDSSVVVEGALRRPREGERPPAGSPGDTAAALDFPSDSLGAVLDGLLGPSDNQAAEMLLRTLGREEGRAATASEGLEVVRAVLTGWGVAPEAFSLADGSGLSRYDELTPAVLVRVLRKMWQSPLAATFASALAAPGEAGTLETRLLDTAAREGLRAKTGSLSSVRGLAGYVRAGDGRTLIFALLVNGYGVPGRVAEGVRDLLVEQLSLYRRRVEPGWRDLRAGPDSASGGARPRP